MSSNPYPLQPQAGSLIKPGLSSPSRSFTSARKENRRFVVFFAFLLTLLLGSSLLAASSGILKINSQVYFRTAFAGKTYFRHSKTIEVLQVQTQDKAEQLKQYKDEALCCDRSHYRTDVCVAQGDVRVASGRINSRRGRGYEVLVFAEGGVEREEVVKPYTRKWEGSVMRKIDEVKILRKPVIELSRRRAGELETGSADATGEDQFGRGNSTQAILRLEKKLQLGGADDEAKLPSAIHAIEQGISKKKRVSYKKRRNKLAGKDAVLLQERRGESVQELIRTKKREAADFPVCEVQHEVPAILFSTGGYTGNVYHEFNDGLIPLFITAQRYISRRAAPAAGQLVLVILEFHSWWMSKYADVLAHITNHTIVDLAHDPRVHCFPEITVGLRIHGELSINSQELQDHASMDGFQALLQAAYGAAAANFASENHLTALSIPAAAGGPAQLRRLKQAPKLVVISRAFSKSRVLTNEKRVIHLARQIGFAVQVLSPTPSTRMVDIYRVLSQCDAMMGVHGAAMTHLLFMRPKSTLIQVVPLGTDWAAHTYYAQPGQKLGLNYVEYKVSPRESSLWERYASDDPVLVNPDSVNSKGWWETKRIYLEGQNVTLSLPKMAVILRSVYAGAMNAA